MTIQDLEQFAHMGHIYYCPYCAAVFMYPKGQSKGDILRISCPTCNHYFFYITETASVGILTKTPYTGMVI